MLERIDLEELALQFHDLPEITWWLVNWGLSSIGCLVGIFMTARSRLSIWSLRRMPYFFLLAVTSVFWALLSFIWLLTSEAIENRLFWLLTLSMVVAIFLFGYIDGVMAHARAVNAYRHGKKGWIAIIPLVNLVLLLARPAERTISSRKQRLINFLGVIAALALFWVELELNEVLDRKLLQEGLK